MTRITLGRVAFLRIPRSVGIVRDPSHGPSSTTPPRVRQCSANHSQNTCSSIDVAPSSLWLSGCNVAKYLRKLISPSSAHYYATPDSPPQDLNGHGARVGCSLKLNARILNLQFPIVLSTGRSRSCRTISGCDCSGPDCWRPEGSKATRLG